MRAPFSPALFALLALAQVPLLGAAGAQEAPAEATAAEGGDGDEDEGEGEDEEYTNKGSWELGGSASFTWTDNVITVALSPTVGYFILQDFELSAIVTFQYQRVEDDATGDSISTESGTFVFEPSYHYGIREDLHVFGGLGLGFGYDGNDWNGDVVPRVGVNIEVGRSGVFTPAARVPIVIGDDTTVGFVIEAGFTTGW